MNRMSPDDIKPMVAQIVQEMADETSKAARLAIRPVQAWEVNMAMEICARFLEKAAQAGWKFAPCVSKTAESETQRRELRNSEAVSLQCRLAREERWLHY